MRTAVDPETNPKQPRNIPETSPKLLSPTVLWFPEIPKFLDEVTEMLEKGHSIDMYIDEKTTGQDDGELLLSHVGIKNVSKNKFKKPKCGLEVK